MDEPDLPLLPGQEWFLQELYPFLLNPSRWSLVRLYRLPAHVPAAAVRASARDVWRRHEALRIRVLHTDDGWRQRVAGPETPEPFRFIDLSRVPKEEQSEEIARIAVEAHGTLNLEAGPMARFIHLHLGDGEPGRLLFLVHHLAGDGLSFVLVQSELDTLLRAHTTGTPATVPSAAAYRECVDAVVDYARSPELLRELAYWRAQPWDDCAELPFDYPPHTTDSARLWTTVRTSMRGADAEALAQRLPGVLGIDLADIVLAAVAETLTAWSGGALCLHVVHHGRTLKRDVRTPADRAAVLPRRAARTVGWFSTHGCMVMRPRTEDRPGAYLRRVKDDATAVPNRGAGLSLLRWTTPPGDHTAIVTRAWQASQVLFNFGAIGGRPADDEVLGVADEATGHRPDPLEPRRQLHVRAHYGGGELTMMWDYDPRLRREQTVDALAERCQNILRSYLSELD